MTFLVVSFIAGVLTVLAPCILPLLPVVIGSSASGRSKYTPYIVVGSLGVSVIIFTYLLKASTVFIMVPPQLWTYISGGILVLFGAILLFPNIWEKVPGLAKLSAESNRLVGSGYQRKSFIGDVLIGAALGPVFSTCSPTYFVILASVLPVSFALGTVYIFSYVFGLSLVLLLIAFLGQRFANRLTTISDSHSYLKRGIGALFIILGILISTGLEKKLETKILDSGYFDITKLEQKLLEKVSTDEIEKTNTSEIPEKSSRKEGKLYKEIVNPSGFVNTSNMPIKIADYVGKKVVLLDVMTYSCINCQRTFPYVTAWYEKYKDGGFIVIGIHTPEFAFEKNKNNVEEAMKKFGINFPVVLDNDYGTWNTYGNHFWPRKYLIDIYGNIVYDHIGEGAYEETEMKIIELLKERKEFLGEAKSSYSDSLVSNMIPGKEVKASSPETYFGSARNEYLANGKRGFTGEQQFKVPEILQENSLYLDGIWNITPEYAESTSSTKIIYKYRAQDVYFVVDAETEIEIEVWQDGEPIGGYAGADVNSEGKVFVKESRLYKIIHNDTPGEHILEFRIKNKGIRAYAFTFG